MHGLCQAREFFERALFYGDLRRLRPESEVAMHAEAPHDGQQTREMCRYPNDMCAMPRRMENVICLSAGLRLVSNDQ
jgi:hypothetical protein